MPELPEVETVRRGLEAGLVGHTIQRVMCHRSALRYPFPPDLPALLEGKHVGAVRRRAKYLLLDVQDITLIAHLGMTGSYVLRPANHPLQPHDHMVWELANGTALCYHDPRRFGFVLATSRAAWASHSMLCALGVEPLSDDFTPALLATAMQKRTVPIKLLLMQASVVVGVGNIYASESLFRARLHPATPSNACVPYADALVAAVRAVLCDALESGGSTLRNYANASGETGYFQHHFAVYHKAGHPCGVCGTPIQRLVQSGRSSFFCAVCQPFWQG